MFDRLRNMGRTGAGLIGIALAVLVVGVAVAIVLVQVTADVTSDEFIPPTTTSSTTTTTAPSNGLQVALGTPPSSCGSFGSGPLVFSGFTFALNSGEALPKQVLCVQNQGGFGAISSITFAPAIASSGEDGCSPAEEAVDPDGEGCGSNGELAGILGFRLTRTFSNGIADSSCSPFSGVGVAPGGSIGLLSSPLSFGGLCIYLVDLVFSGTPTNDQKLAASTDTATFTIDVSALP